MAGKRVLVSGSGTGIGPGVALAFARRGADVAFHYGHSEAGARAAVEDARKMGVRAEAFGADFNEVDQVFGLAKAAIDFLGGIDVLVNNAGITMNRPFEDVTVEQFDTLYNVNITGHVLPDAGRGRGHDHAGRWERDQPLFGPRVPWHDRALRVRGHQGRNCRLYPRGRS